MFLALHRPQLGAVLLLEHAADNKLRNELFLPESKPVLRRVLFCRDCVLYAFDIAPLARFGGPLDQLGEDLVDWWAGESRHIVRRQAIDERHDAVEDGHCCHLFENGLSLRNPRAL